MTSAIQQFQALTHAWEQTYKTEKMQKYREAKIALYQSYQHFRASHLEKVDLDQYNIRMDTPVSWVIMRKFTAWDQFSPKEDPSALRLGESLRNFVSAYTDSTEDRTIEHEAKEALEQKVHDLFVSYSGRELSKFIQTPHSLAKIGKWERQLSLEQLSSTASGRRAAAIVSEMGGLMAAQGVWGAASQVFQTR